MRARLGRKTLTTQTPKGGHRTHVGPWGRTRAVRRQRGARTKPRQNLSWASHGKGKAEPSGQLSMGQLEGVQGARGAGERSRVLASGPGLIRVGADLVGAQ